MKNVKRVLSLVLCGVLCAGTVVAAGCGNKKGSDDPQTLDIYCYIAGYRDKWLTSTVELFKEQDWVKEKYPELKINYSSDSLMDTAINKLNTPSSNSYDLLFCEELSKYVPTSQLEDLTDIVYNKTVPGENVKVIDKVPDYVKAVITETSGSTASYYKMKVIDSFYGMMYNNSVYQQESFKYSAPPVTTNELIEQIEYVESSGYKYTYKGKEQNCQNGLMISAANSYAQWMFPLYWMQYEGLENYENYFEGKYYDEASDEYIRSPKVVTQTGRLRALEFIEDLLKNYSNSDAKDLNHTSAQTNFLVGNGLFHWNGDYFVSEMEDTKNALKEKDGISYDIRYMQAPVLSSIVEVLEGSVDETLLRETIREIDNEKSWADSAVKDKISEKDYNRLIEARRVRGDWFVSTFDAVIAKDSPAKELASDFMAFMYSDKAIKNFSENSYGLAFPVNYYENLSDSEYEEMSAKFDTVQKSKFDIMYRYKTYSTTRIPSEYAFTLGKNGLSRITSFKGVMGTTFVLGSQTAKNIYENDIRYWFGLDKDADVYNEAVLNGASKSEWVNLLKLAGLQ